MADRRGLFTSIGGAVDSAFNMLA
nr:putative VP4 [tremovirus B1]